MHNVLWSVNGRTFTHTLAVVETGAEAIFMDEYASADGEAQGFHNGVIELLVGDNAKPCVCWFAGLWAECVAI